MRDMLGTLLSLSFFAGAAQYICPDGRAQRVLKLLCTAILAAAILSPLREIDYDLLSLEEARFAGAEAEITRRAEQTQEQMKKLLVQENCENYIINRGQELGLRISDVSVELKRDENGGWLPHAATIQAYGENAAAQDVGRLIAVELGIPAERQVWTLNE